MMMAVYGVTLGGGGKATKLRGLWFSFSWHFHRGVATLKQPHAVPRIFVEVPKKRVNVHANKMNTIVTIYWDSTWRTWKPRLVHSKLTKF